MSLSIPYRYAYYAPDNSLRVARSPPKFNPDWFPAYQEKQVRPGDFVQRTRNEITEHGYVMYVDRADEDVGVKFYKKGLETLDLDHFDGNYETRLGHVYWYLFEDL